MVGTAIGQRTSFFSERSARLNGLVARSGIATSDVPHDFPLLKVIRLPAPNVALLQDAARWYIWENLAAWHGSGSITFTTTILEEHANDILTLPNRTPNGLIQPKRPVLASLNMLHRALALTFRQLKLTPEFNALQMPVNVRVVGGLADRAVDDRPYASSKIHTDAWNREPLSALLFNLPLLGNADRVAIQYYSFREPKPEQFAPLADYAAMHIDPAELIGYDAPFVHGHLYMSDQTSLHQTVRRGGDGIRLSLDFRAVVQDLVGDESHDVSQSSANYANVTTWDQIGSNIMLTSDQPLDSFQRRQRGEIATEPPVEMVNVDGLIST